MRLSAISLIVFSFTSLAWANDQWASILIPKIGTVIIRSHIDKSPSLSSPFLTIENAEGKMLKRIDFELKGVNALILYPSLLNFKVVYPEKESSPIVVAVASSPGGSDIHFETTLIGFLNGKIVELTPNHIESSSQDALCLENLGAGRPIGLVFFNFLWEEAHYDPHRYEAILYEWSGTKLDKISVKQTKERQKDWKGAAAELGYHCGEDLIRTTNSRY
jgi:hypothetical protein